MVRLLPECLIGLTGVKIIEMPRFCWIVLFNVHMGEGYKGMVINLLKSEGFTVRSFGTDIWVDSFNTMNVY